MKTTLTSKLTLASCLALLCGASFTQAQVLSTWSADADATPADATWNDSSGNGVDIGFQNIGATGSGNGQRVAVTGQSFDFAYRFGDTVSRAFNDPSLGAPIQPAAITDSGKYFQLDMWFNAGNVTQQSALFSDGGGASGYSLALDGSNLRFFLKSGAATGAVPTISLLSDTAVAADTWYKATVQIDQVGNSVSLFLNDSLVASETGTTFGSFYGGNHTAIAGKNLTNMGGTVSAGSTFEGASYYGLFNGDIASVQLALVPEPGAFSLLAGAAGLVFVMLRRRRD